MGPEDPHDSSDTDPSEGAHGDPSDGLAQLIYAELRTLAGVFMRSQSPGHTLQPTALVNEAYLRLAKSSPEALRSRSHFLAVAAKAMRHILINHAVAKRTAKRGGGAARVPLEGAMVVDAGLDQYEVLAIHQALELLEAVDPRRAQVVEAKVFGGLTNGEIAEILSVSTTTVESDWRTARAWLAVELDSRADQAGRPKAHGS